MDIKGTLKQAMQADNPIDVLVAMDSYNRLTGDDKRLFLDRVDKPCVLPVETNVAEKPKRGKK